MDKPKRLDENSVAELLSRYNVGKIQAIEAFASGTVQENLLIRTSTGDYVLRRYLNRSLRSTEFELRLLLHLGEIGFPCAQPIEDRYGCYHSVWEERPIALFSFVPGYSPESLTPSQQYAVIDAVALLHRATENNEKYFSPDRWNYSTAFCRERLIHAAKQSRREDVDERLVWLLDQLAACEIPCDLPKGVCHCDFASNNLIFEGNALRALLDFDDANYTWLAYDLVNLMDNWCCSDFTIADWDSCAAIVRSYSQRRPLTPSERSHLFDVHRFQI